MTFKARIKVSKDELVPLSQLANTIERGLAEGTIEWGGTSDFVFAPIDVDARFMLCNDADLHFSSADEPLMLSISTALLHAGVRVFESGVPLHLDT